ncbi:mucin TcMUCII [Trypanosoma cruzi]|nr:mucin TcMUCII [Trypanosoma cruzi]
MIRRYQLRPVAQAGASHHTMRSFLIVYVHSVSLYCGEAIVPCLAQTYLHNMEVRYRDGSKTSLGLSAPKEYTSVYLQANPVPLRKILWILALTQYERYIRLHDYEDLRSLTHSEHMPPSMREKRRHQSRFREMLLLMNYAAYVILLGYPTATIVLLLFNIVFSPGTLCVAIKWNLSATLCPRRL